MEELEPFEQSEGPDEPRVGSVILSLGSNEGDRVRYLERGLEGLRREVKLEAVSSVYETQPVGVRDQPWFLNLVCIGTTRLKPAALLEFIHGVEDVCDRVRMAERYGPRTLDIDIIAYDDQVRDQYDLKIPHPKMHERRFVLEPLAEIAPDWRHPVEGKTVSELIEELDGDVVRPYSDPPPASGPAPIL
jgi:2-amino-4-hydroxy-6-hydroxymethyldihydropteridine diphosphokinase